MLRFFLSASVVVAAALSPSGSGTVRIFAAASLTDVLGEALSAFARAHPDIRVVPQFGGSSELARQIVAGAPADLFFSADERQMNRVAEAGLTDEGRQRKLLSNQLVVVMPASSATPLARLEDLPPGRIAMADPESVPAGVYARRYLETRGFWAGWARRVIPTLDVRAALAAVASGNVVAGFVYRTDASLEPRVRVVYEVPLEEGPEIVYPLALTGAEPSPEARALFDFFSSSEARSLFEGYGFVLLPETR